MRAAGASPSMYRMPAARCAVEDRMYSKETAAGRLPSGRLRRENKP